LSDQIHCCEQKVVGYLTNYVPYCVYLFSIIMQFIYCLFSMHIELVVSLAAMALQNQVIEILYKNMFTNPIDIILLSKKSFSIYMLSFPCHPFILH
jgi:hypothetical protein